MNYTMERWNINKSSDLYGVSEWGGGFFFIAENGDMMVMPEPGAVDRGVSIAAISSGIRERGFDMPVLLRIENILDAQITSLNETFRSATAAVRKTTHESNDMDEIRVTGWSSAPRGRKTDSEGQ